MRKSKAAIGLVVLIMLVLATSAVWARSDGPETEEPMMEAVGGGMYNDSPFLAARVQSGELPPVDERLPNEPAVGEILGEIGVYGGPLYTFATSNGAWSDFGDLQENGVNWIHQTYDSEFRGDLMSDWSIAADDTSFTVSFREGQKWSDGVPVSVDDFEFTVNGMHLHPDVSTWGMAGMPISAIVPIDDRTFRIELQRPVPGLQLKLARLSVWSGPQCLHHLGKYHIDYNEDANELAEEEGFSIWHEALYNHFWWSPAVDLDRPVVQPWILMENSSALKRLERNPYYHKVDPAGNQLPYIDEIITPIVDGETYNIKIISGESDVAFMATTFENYILYKENEQSGDYVVHELAGTTASHASIVFNYNTPDPYLNQLTKDINFKAGLSHAINRDEINEIVHLGKGVPRQAAVLPTLPWYKPEWAEAYAEYDVDLAKRFLDEAGLTETNNDGFRLREDNGQILEWVIDFPTGGQSSGTIRTLELIKEYWEAVGVKTILHGMDNNLFQETEHSGLIVSKVRATSVDNHFNLGHWANVWGQWITQNRRVEQGISSLEDYEGGVLPGIEPPQWAKDYEALFYGRANVAPDSPEFAAFMQEAMDMQAENLFLIGTVGITPEIVIAKPYIYNLPTSLHPAVGWLGAASEYNEQVFIRK